MGNLWSSPSPPPGSAVVVTGCDTGFGHQTALSLAKDGFRVYAGCLTDKGIKSLTDAAASRGIDEKSIVTFKLDVTKEEDAKRCWELVDKEEGGLYALVNNAGIGDGGFFESMEMGRFEQVFQVNTFGAVRMSRWLLPSLRKYSKQNPTLPPSRIVNITSAAGRIGAPAMSAYCGSKFALEAISDCLRRELKLQGHRVDVAVIEPFFAKTPIVDILDTSPEALVEKFKDGLIPELRDQVVEDYGGEDCVLWNAQRMAEQRPPIMDPKHVVNTITSQVKNPTTCERTVVGNVLEKSVLWAFENLSERWIDWALFELEGKRRQTQWRAELEEREKAAAQTVASAVKTAMLN
ncbi:NAD(P)-binding protein [Gonapodya prolifera JEL478]|uniref:NAD(P)-binding protein n=1 Tax=Gonapodya prolifera (strain JEL478) TaxID=1344416 RepID=A0A139AX10_GONPJ|nr:NAD(P)-binding protein [Gonapodya prolifera JEL478]|eukprot:KXS21276.1 NAD(P)-binding protein [Gonapodya prolifera JEL478]